MDRRTHSQPSTTNFVELWSSLAEQRYRGSQASKASQVARSDLFQESVEAAFYILARGLAGRDVRVEGAHRVQATTFSRTDLARLLPKTEVAGDGGPEDASGFSDRLERWLATATLKPNEIGYGYEKLYGVTPSSGNRGDAGRASSRNRDRNTHGVFYTPDDLVNELCEASLARLLSRLSDRQSITDLAIVDPAMGGGRFLLGIASHVELWGKSLSNGVGINAADIGKALYGVDRDPFAVDVAKLSLWLALGADAVSIDVLNANLQTGDSLTGPVLRDSCSKARGADGDLEWSVAFPQVFDRANPGFDLVIGNPPWGKVRSEFKRFVTAFVSEARNLQGAALRQHVDREGGSTGPSETAGLWQRHRETAATYALRLKQRFAVETVTSSRGDADLYKYFSIRSHALARDGGQVALIVPGSLRNTEGAASIRKLYLDAGSFDLFTERTNAGRHFPIHSMFRFVSFAYTKGSPGGIAGLTFVHGRRRSVPVRLNLPELTAIGGDDLMIPEVRSPEEAALLSRLYGTHPRLGQAGEWNVRFVREVDMTAASDRFIASPKSADPTSTRALPVYEGRMVGQFDYAAKAYVRGEGRTAVWRRLELGEKAVVPHYYLPVEASGPRFSRYMRPRAGFCDITGHANARTVLAAIIPGGAVAGNKVPTLKFEPEDSPRLHLIWTALANSLVVDWLVRRRISTTLNYFHWYAIPFPRIDPRSEVGERLANLAGALTNIESTNEDLHGWLQTAIGQNPAVLTTSAERQRYSDEIDNLAFQLYDLTPTEIAIICSDFKHCRQASGHIWPASTEDQRQVEKALVARSGEIVKQEAGPRLATEMRLAS